MPGRARTILRRLAVTVLLPLAFVLIGVWQSGRGAAHLAELEIERERAAKAVAVLAARAPRDGRPDLGMQFRRDGQNYSGPYALTQARAALDDAEVGVTIGWSRRYLPPVVVAAAASAAALSLLVLLAAWALGRRGRASRDSLVAGFSVARRALPFVLAASVLLATAAAVPALAFEASALLSGGFGSSGGIKVLVIAGMGIVALLWIGFGAILGLRRAVAAFSPEPAPVLGRRVSREEAPGLWRLMDDLAARLGALRPDDVVVGLTGGFFVSSGPKVLQPGGAALAGRTLYVPLPYLALLREDEVATIIGHELAHFSGNDTEYSLRFLPIYVGVDRSLHALVTAGAGGKGIPVLLRPALMLGDFVMERFDHAVQHWSRRRELEADAAGAAVTSPDAAARALVRTAALRPRIEEALDRAARAPDAAGPDLVAGILGHVVAEGTDDPAAHLEEEEPHPTDTHPPTRARLLALGRPPGPALLAEAAVPPPPDALARLDGYFADPAAIGRAATEDFLGVLREDRRAFRAGLEEMAREVEPDEVVLRENLRSGGLFMIAMGAVFALLGFGLLAFDTPDGEATVTWILIGFGLLFGTGFAAWGVVLLRRHDRPFIILRPGEVAVPGLDVPIAWRHVLGLDIVAQGRGATVALLLAPAAPWPRRVKGGGRAKLDRERRVVTVSATLPRGMKSPAFTELVGRHRRAAEARRMLEEEVSATGPRGLDPWLKRP